MRKSQIVIALLSIIGLASVIEFCAILHGINGKAIQAYIGIVGVAIGALTSMIIKYKKEKNEDV
jgi:hypothetical protein